MKLRILRLWQTLRSSYWFLPVLLSLAAAALAILLGSVDQFIQDVPVPGLPSLRVADPAGARAILSTVAASSITVAGVVFSITIVVLATASAQFGPRLLPNFMRQNSTQFVLGGFLGTFIYCLLVLTRIRDEAGLGEAVESVSGAEAVPQLSVAGGLALAILSFGLLIYFIQRVTVFVQAPRIIEDVAADLLATLERLFPERTEAPESARASPDEREIAAATEPESAAIVARASGYVQALNVDQLLGVAGRHDLMLKLQRRVGHFVVSGHVVARAFPAEAVTEDVERAVQSAFMLGATRTTMEDPEFAIDQLVEVAVRALSPGVNDPFTAMNCIDRLGVALSFLAERRPPSAYRRDEDGRLRVILHEWTYAGILDAAFTQIRQHARTNEAVSLHLLGTIGMLGERELPAELREALSRHAELIYQGSRANLPQSGDRPELEERYETVVRALERRAAGTGRQPPGQPT